MSDRSRTGHWFGKANQYRTSAIELRDNVVESSRNDEGLEALAARDIPKRTRSHAAI
jgi:hypothetical protein